MVYWEKDIKKEKKLLSEMKRCRIESARRIGPVKEDIELTLRCKNKKKKIKFVARCPGLEIDEFSEVEIEEI